MFSIWHTADKKVYAMVEPLTKEDAQVLRAIGWRWVANLKAKNAEDATEEFVAWSKERAPNAKVESRPHREIQAHLLRKVLD